MPVDQAARSSTTGAENFFLNCIAGFSMYRQENHASPMEITLVAIA